MAGSTHTEPFAGPEVEGVGETFNSPLNGYAALTTLREASLLCPPTVAMLGKTMVWATCN